MGFVVFIDRRIGLGWLSALLMMLLAILLSASASAATTAREYAGRLQQAEQTTDELIDRDPPASPEDVVATMRAIKQLLPLREDVEMDGQTIRANNAWLHQAIDLVIKNARGDEEQLRSMLFEIADRLTLLKERLSASLNQSAASAQDQRARLERILARREYAPEDQKESAVQRWLKKLGNKILYWLARLFGAGRTGGLNAGTVSLVRVVIALVVLAAASFGLARLLRRLSARRKKEKDEDVREVLGEELADDVTAGELLSRANELAGQGDFRSAIRRAYIALLCEMEQRGKVRLHRAKTNRDYLDELKPERSLYPTFSVMTGAFEHVWYGHEHATESAFNDFITLYQETVG